MKPIRPGWYSVRWEPDDIPQVVYVFFVSATGLSWGRDECDDSEFVSFEECEQNKTKWGIMTKWEIDSSGDSVLIKADGISFVKTATPRVAWKIVLERIGVHDSLFVDGNKRDIIDALGEYADSLEVEFMVFDYSEEVYQKDNNWYA